MMHVHVSLNPRDNEIVFNKGTPCEVTKYKIKCKYLARRLYWTFWADGWKILKFMLKIQILVTKFRATHCALCKNSQVMQNDLFEIKII